MVLPSSCRISCVHIHPYAFCQELSTFLRQYVFSFFLSIYWYINTSSQSFGNSFLSTNFKSQNFNEHSRFIQENIIAVYVCWAPPTPSWNLKWECIQAYMPLKQFSTLVHLIHISPGDHANNFMEGVPRKMSLNGHYG